MTQWPEARLQIEKRNTLAFYELRRAWPTLKDGTPVSSHGVGFKKPFDLVVCACDSRRLAYIDQLMSTGVSDCHVLTFGFEDRG
jgi:hypothetical protein